MTDKKFWQRVAMLMAVTGLFGLSSATQVACPEQAKSKAAVHSRTAENTTTYFYVAPDGDDDPGMLKKPFKTMARARDAIRKLKATTGLQQPINVLLRGGTYYLSQPLIVGTEDPGTQRYPITYKAYR